MKKFLKVLKVLGIILVVIIVGPILVGFTMKTFKSVPAPTGEMVDVGGYKLHINCIGPKKPQEDSLPTVIVESGSGTISSLYHWIQQGVSETTRVCVYDRPGIGRSEESDLPRDAETVAKTLNVLLDKVEVKRPFVFAGHSIAGFYTRQYVEMYPNDVAGIVFIDASHPDQGEVLGMDMASQLPVIEQQMSLFKIFIKLGLSELYNPMMPNMADPAVLAYPSDVPEQLKVAYNRPEHLGGSFAEIRDFNAAAEQAARNTTLGDMPIVVISAAEQRFEPWIELHKELAALSTNSRHVLMDTANHMSMIFLKDNADKVVSYIKEVVLEVAAQE